MEKQNSKNDRTVVIVLGMHRSGTSMLAGLLDRLGCKGPKELMRADDSNPKGYFESYKVMALNDRVLAAAGTRWNDWQKLSNGWHKSPRFEELKQDALEVIKSEYGNGSLIYLKDPRICRTLPFWKEVFEEMRYRVVCLMTYRSPLEVAASLEARKGISETPHIGLLIWLRYILDAETNSRGLPRVFTNYGSLLKNWQKTLDAAEQVFGFSWPATTMTARNSASDMVDAGLRHHVSNTRAISTDTRLGLHYHETLAVLDRWVEHGETGDDYSMLDGIRTQFDEAATLLGPAAMELGQVSSNLAKINEEYEKQKEDSASQADEIEKLTERLAEEAGLKAQLTSQVAQLREEITQSYQTNEEAKRQIADLGHARECAEKNANQTSHELAQVQKQLNDLTVEIETWSKRVIERDQRINSIRKKASTQLAAVEKEKVALRQRNQQLRRDFQNSTSWRVTAPMRAVSRIIRRIVR